MKVNCKIKLAVLVSITDVSNGEVEIYSTTENEPLLILSVPCRSVVELRINNQSVGVDEFSRMCLWQVPRSSAYVLQMLMSFVYRTLLIKVPFYK